MKIFTDDLGDGVVVLPNSFQCVNRRCLDRTIAFKNGDRVPTVAIGTGHTTGPCALTIQKIIF